MSDTSIVLLAAVAVTLGAAALGVVAAIVYSAARPPRRSTFVPLDPNTEE